jgi:hypothetical protein
MKHLLKYSQFIKESESRTEPIDTRNKSIQEIISEYAP